MINLRVLNSLVKLSKTNIDIVKLKIEKLSTEISVLQKIITDIDKEIKDEKNFFSMIESANISIIAEVKDNFVHFKFEKQKSVLNEMVKLYKKFENLQEELLNEYQTLKKYELIKEKQEKEKKSRLDLLESNRLTENINSKIAEND